MRRLASCWLLLLAACSRPADPVRRVLDELAAAAERRDAQAVADLLTPDFQAADGSGREEAVGTVRQYFAGYEDLRVSLSDVTIERGDQAARVRFRADLSGRARKIAGLEGLLPRSSSYRFDLRLAPDGKRWRVAWAAWQEAETR